MIGDKPIESKFRERMLEIARRLDESFNPDASEREVGFVLLVFPFDATGNCRCNYISNGNRADIIAMFKEQIAYFEGHQDIKGHA
jgi:hypothetical protein